MWNGPQSQIGLIWTSPPSRKRTPAVPNMSPSERGAWPGHAGTPTMVRSVCAVRCRNCVWCRIATSNRCAPSSSPIRIGKIRTWAMYIRGQSLRARRETVPSNSQFMRFAPTNGIESPTE